MHVTEYESEQRTNDSPAFKFIYYLSPVIIVLSVSLLVFTSNHSTIKFMFNAQYHVRIELICVFHSFSETFKQENKHRVIQKTYF